MLEQLSALRKGATEKRGVGSGRMVFKPYNDVGTYAPGLVHVQEQIVGGRAPFCFALDEANAVIG